MGSLLDTLYSCDTTLYIGKEIKYNTHSNKFLPRTSSTYFASIFFVRISKDVWEERDRIDIKIKGIIRFTVYMPNIRQLLRYVDESDLKRAMVDQINEILQGTYQKIKKEVKSVCDTAFFVYGPINKPINIIPDIEVETDGQFI